MRILTAKNIYIVMPSHDKKGKIDDREKETLIIGFGHFYKPLFSILEYTKYRST